MCECNQYIYQQWKKYSSYMFIAFEKVHSFVVHVLAKFSQSSVFTYMETSPLPVKGCKF